MMQNADAVVLMYNPENRGHEREIELWYEWYVARTLPPPLAPPCAPSPPAGLPLACPLPVRQPSFPALE